MSPDAEFLVALFQANRERHGPVWRKIRRDRVHKLLPHFEDHELAEMILSECIVHGRLMPCSVQTFNDREGSQHPAIKLVKFIVHG